MSQNEEYRYVSAARSNKKKKSKLRIGRILIVLLLVVGILVAAAAITWKLLSNTITETYISQEQSGQLVDTIVATPDEYKGDWVNILVAGVSNNPDDLDYPDEYNGIGMTDIIMYVSYDVKNNKVSVLQIPRDTYVGNETSVGHNSTGKINALYGSGKYKDTDPISNLAEVVQEQYKLNIDYYATVDIAAFTEIINLLGGIEMYVPYDIWDDVGNSISKGTHYIDGETARWILRQRHCYAQADIQRMETQQYFYAACFELFKSCTVSDLTKHVLPVVAYRVNTDMPFETMTSLAISMMKLNASNIYITKLLGGATMVNGQSVFVINPERTATLLNDYFRPYGDPVAAAGLGLPTGVAAPTEIADTGKYLVNIIVE